MKGSDLIDPLLERLHADGVIEYRRVQDIEPKEMPAIYGDADIVVDQLALGSYGVAACEAMAAGRIVLGHVSEQVRSAAQEAAGLDSVSYTHLRAHETVLDLVCRLLLE